MKSGLSFAPRIKSISLLDQKLCPFEVWWRHCYLVLIECFNCENDAFSRNPKILKQLVVLDDFGMISFVIPV